MDIILLMGRHAIGYDRPEDYIAWAEGQMLNGVDSENLPILASMDFDKPIDSFEVQQCFNKVVGELGLTWLDVHDFTSQYCEVLCGQILGEQVNPRDSAEVLAGMHSQGVCDEPLLLYWFYLHDDLKSLCFGHDAFYNYGLTKRNIDVYIKHMAAQHLKLTKLNLPSGFQHFFHCQKCGHTGEACRTRATPKWLPKFIHRLLARDYMDGCEKCGSKSIRPMTSYEGRQAFLEHTERAA